MSAGFGLDPFGLTPFGTGGGATYSNTLGPVGDGAAADFGFFDPSHPSLTGFMSAAGFGFTASEFYGGGLYGTGVYGEGTGTLDVLGQFDTTLATLEPA